MTKKIVYVMPTLPVYRHDFLVSLHGALKNSQYELVVVTGLNNWNKVIVEINNELPFKVVRCKTVGFKVFGLNFNWQKGFIKSVFSEKPDKVIIMYHTGKLNHSLLLLRCLMKGIPFVFWGSGYRRVDMKGFTLKFKHGIKRFFENKSKGYITYSQYFADILVKKGYPKNKIIVAQNTINVEKIIDRQRQLPSAKEGIFTFLFVGALIPMKRLELAFRACTELRDRGYTFRFDVVGGGVIFDQMRDLVNQLGLGNYVFLNGPKFGEDVIPFFTQSHVFVLPGTGGLAINEAMAYGLPVISAPGDGTAYDLIENWKTGFVLENGYHVDQLIAHMKFFLDLDEEGLQQMSRNSRERIRRIASLRNMVDKFALGVQELGE